MSVKDLLAPVFDFGARTCEKSPAVAQLVRRFDFRGKGSIVQRIRSEAMSREVTAVCDGLLYRLDLRDDIQRELYFNRYERADIQQALALIPFGGTCLDIGANNGAFALQLARKVGEKGRVYAAEPDPYVFARLVQNCRLNGYEGRVHCHNIALTNANGPIVFYRSDRGHSGWGSLVRFSDIAAGAQQVPGVTLDEFVKKERVETVDLLKIDVEAHEPELLEGARNSLAKRLFRFLLIEFNGVRLAERGKTLRDFLQPLLSAGYQPMKFRLDLLKRLQLGALSAGSVCTNFLFEAR
jgi:FkbM family methyltransferase